MHLKISSVKWLHLVQEEMSYTETKMSSFWRNFNHWLHWKLSFWQLPVQPVMKISSKWRHFRFSVRDPWVLVMHIQWTRSSLVQMVTYYLCLPPCHNITCVTYFHYYTLRNKIQWNFNHSEPFSFKNMHLLYAVCKLPAILFRLQWVNS